MQWLQAMPANRRRGSCPRCLLLLQGNRDEISRRLTGIIGWPEIHVTVDDFWMPRGLCSDPLSEWDRSCLDEARLGESDGLLSPEERRRVNDWWLTVVPKANTPNWDIASTCTIAGKRGFLLIEAKAHDSELRAEEKGKSLEPTASVNSRRNHALIGWCIEDASIALSGNTSLQWSLSRNHHYQMCNRFAWAWKLTELGYPVVLMYLGFLNAVEMQDRGQPFHSHADWEKLVMDHSSTVFPANVWGTQWIVNDKSLVPLVRSIEQPFT